MNKIVKYLNEHIIGNVYDRPAILEAYSTDRSVLKVLPRFVALPEMTEDIQKLVQFSNELAKKEYELPITVRGSGLDKTGGDLGGGLIVSMEKMNRVQEIDDRSRLVRVQAGVTLEKLNAVLAVYGLTLPIKANPKETIGGLIAGYPADTMAKKYGGIYAFTERIEAVLSDGEILQTTRFTRRGLEHHAKSRTDFIGSIYRHIDDIIEDNVELLEKIRKSPRDLSGYRTLTQVRSEKNGSFDLMPLFFSSQGTLGVITEVILRVEPIPRPATRILVTFRSIRTAVKFLTAAAELEPASLTIYDSRIFAAAAKAGKTINITPKASGGYYVLVCLDDAPYLQSRKAKVLLNFASSTTSITVENEKNAAEFSKLNAGLMSYLNDGIEGERTSLVDDFYLPANELADFATGLHQLETTFDLELPIFGSFSIGTYNIRPELNLRSVVGRQKAVSFLRAYATFLADHNGSIVGAGGEGRTKALFTNGVDKEILEIYAMVKAAFDPLGVFNPEVKLGASNRGTLRYLRAGDMDGITSI